MSTESAPSFPILSKEKGTARRSTVQSFPALLAFLLILGGSAAAIFVAGGADQGNLGIFLLCAGVALVICPPQTRINPWIALSAAGFIGCGALALLPARFFHVLLWRRALASVPDLPLPQTVSAAPGQTFFWLTILTITVLISLFLPTQPVRSRSLLGLAASCVTVCGVYAALSIFAKLSGWNYPFSGGATFGFLPNRNHTATLLITGSLLAVGILGVAFRERRWLMVDAAVAALTLCVAGLFFFSESRAGVVFLLLGVLGWLVVLGKGHRDRPRLLAVILVILAGSLLFLALKSDARDRLLASLRTGSAAADPLAHPDPAGSTERPNGGITTDDRLRIYRDTLGVIHDAPLTGTGLGTFSLVFPPYRLASANVSLVLHPESDWLMVAAEMGLPALFGLGGLVFLRLRGWRPPKDTCLLALALEFSGGSGAAILHGLVDVPVHRAALGWWVLALAGLALQPGHAPDGPARPRGLRWARGVFVLGGLVALGLGFALVRAEWFGGPALPPFAAKQAENRILSTYKRGDAEGAWELACRAVQVSPLAGPLYYQQGVLALKYEGMEAEVERAFHMQRLLNPLPPDIPQTQGVMWISVDPARTATLFADALGRQERLRPGAVGAGSAADYWRSLVAQIAPYPQAQILLWETSVGRGPAFILAWLEGAVPTAVKEKLPLLATDEAFLSHLTPTERGRLIAVWQSKGDADGLRVFKEAHGSDRGQGSSEGR